MARPQRVRDDDLRRAATEAAPVWLPLQEAAARARCSVRTIQRAIACGELPAGGTPGRRLVRRDLVDAWLSGRDGRPGLTRTGHCEPETRDYGEK